RTDAELELSVERDLDTMRAVVDPQNWSTCGPEFWARSYPIADPGDGPIDWKVDPAPLPKPPKPGTPWNEILFEHVRVNWGGPIVQFQVALHIDAKESQLGDDIGYGLRRPIMSALGAIEVAGGIKIDAGEIHAKAASASGPTAIAATKSFKVADLGPPPTD